MEGKYTKIGTAIAFLALLITFWQINKTRAAEFNGEWIMNSTIQKAEKSSYVGMEIEWVLHIIQNGNNVEGKGEKIKVNNEILKYSERTRLTFKGIVTGDKFSINFTEYGKTRETDGSLEGEIKGNKFKGIFSSRASESKGLISGKKKE